ncbi:MarR family winged helix-turn-helix transcriptional regulator [Sulfitobacter sp. S190]|uniref:MarR family winged helix-turn-helix transcriptional regulator n=1 Tax=Sulfitobacter sp. S190 TaxID=2867022 RepID=UPI0021A5D3ED|nr:MarR family transcriptional regulator [Sulfitobacter sp. S190]UWR22503.1 MarR family transcriptional regulator [Sulfitobacter sp. S190]
MADDKNTLAILLFSEILGTDQILRNRLAKVLPKGMELSHFSVLNHLAWREVERTPAQLAETFHVTRGAMSNTLSKLEWAGYIHMRPDWDDARRKLITISPSGRKARDAALSLITPMISQVADELGEDKVRAVIPTLRELRRKMT